MLHTRPDIACHAYRAYQVSERIFEKNRIKKMNDGE